MCLTEIGCEDGGWIGANHDGVQWRALILNDVKPSDATTKE